VTFNGELHQSSNTAVTCVLSVMAAYWLTVHNISITTNSRQVIAQTKNNFVLAGAKNHCWRSTKII